MAKEVMNALAIKEFADLAGREGLLPVRVTPHYRQLVEEEVAVLNGTSGPLYKVAYPTNERIAVRSPSEARDFVQDQDNMIMGLEDVAIHKYRNRVLFLMTDKCNGHCMYCFRQNLLANQHRRVLPSFSTKLDALIRYLQKHAEVQEVVLSGGEPLSVPYGYLRNTLQRIRNDTSVRDIRVHTRNVVFSPRVFTERTCCLFGDYNVRLVIHVVHPYELDKDAIQAIQRLQSSGVRCYGQFPILRGINDHYLILERLLSELDALRVRPLSLFIADPIRYSASFRIPLKRIFSIVDELAWRTSAWTNSVRLVLDTPIGKVRREDITGWDEEHNLVIFYRDGKQITYPDFPQELDTPGDIAVLLWKG